MHSHIPLIPEPSRFNRGISNREMMDNFDKLNQEYNKMAEARLGTKFIVDHVENNLNISEENIFNIIEKAKKEMKMFCKSNEDLKQKVLEYETYSKEAMEMLNSMEKLNQLYSKLSKRFQNIDDLIKYDRNLDVKKNIFDADLKNQIQIFKDKIKILIDTNLNEINKNNKKIASFKTLIRECLKDEDNDYEINICNICVTNKIDTCLNPCGHTFCLNCVDKMHNSCAMCRKIISTKIKMYIVDNDEESDDVSGYEISSPAGAGAGAGGIPSAFDGYSTLNLLSDYS